LWLNSFTQLKKKRLIVGGRLRYVTANGERTMDAARKQKISLKVNGVEHSREVEPRLLLVYFLRDVLGLTGTHIGCDTSNCGACTIMVDGMAVKSCTMLAVQADGAELLTIEGLSQGDKLHPLQEGFWECHGLQCGFCTPGMILAAHQLLMRNSNPSEMEIRHAIDGNLCRCTGYEHIVDSVQYAMKKMKSRTKRRH
jgi:carbon-monoxide dehydrogenase small subunit